MTRPDLSQGYDGWQILYPHVPNEGEGKAWEWAQDYPGLQEMKTSPREETGAAGVPKGICVL